jgi:hypothetical protein
MLKAKPLVHCRDARVERGRLLLQRLGTASLFLCALALILTSGCASCVQQSSRPFDFKTDTFAYRNDLLWEYVFDDATGKTTHRDREPRPEYTHHCFVVARSARQFFQFAKFDVTQPIADDATYRKLIRTVTGRDPMLCLAEKDRIVIPGFANLREFSTARPKLIQEESGGAWRSYFQRGHWRMMMGFTEGNQEREAKKLIARLEHNIPPVVHIVKFPQLTINHSIVVIGVEQDEKQIRFVTYDPYEPNIPQTLTFDRATRQFTFPRNPYFIGGPVDIYEIYRAWNY